MNDNYFKDLKDGYYKDGKLKLVFVDGYPQEVAKMLSFATPKMSTKQARSFFDNVNKIYMNAVLERHSFDEAIVELKMLKSRVSDKFGKGSISKEFNDFVSSNVDAVESFKDLKAFALHFEAVCNYLKGDNAHDSGFRKNNFGNNNQKYNRY